MYRIGRLIESERASVYETVIGRLIERTGFLVVSRHMVDLPSSA